MEKKGNFLVVGGDSLVGGGLIRALKRRGYTFFSSTRRRETLNDSRIYLDFESVDEFRVPEGVDYVYVVAAATNYERCEKDPMAHKTNVELIPRLIASLLSQGVFVTFISTNSVFGGDRPWPQEDDPHAPGIPYAKQKHLAEAVVNEAARGMGTEHLLNIVRLTKILDPNTPPIPAWVSSWEKGEKVSPFADLIFAPMSVQFVGEALATLGELRIPGCLHLSGAANVSYVDFANAVAQHLGVAQSLLAPTTATERGIHIAFKPKFSGLGMQKTTRLSGIQPQPLSAVISDIFNTANN